MPSKQYETPLRPLAALLFLPGFYLVLLLTATLAIALAAYGIKLGRALLLHVPWVGISIMLACALAGMGGVVSVLRAILESRKASSVRVFALRVKRAEAAGVWDAITRVSQRLKVRPPSNLILEFGPNIFVTDGEANLPDATVRGRTLCISAPLLRVLTVEEFEGVLAHEMAHFTGNDTIYSHRFYPVYRGSLRALVDLSNHAGEGGWHYYILLLPMLLVSGYLTLFARVERKIGRTRELRADAIGAEACSPKTMAHALAKVHAFGPLWRITPKWMVEWLKAGNAFVNVPAFFVEYLRRNLPALVRTLRDAPPAHPFNTHPSFAERAQALGFPLFEPQFMLSGPAAATLCPELESFEERLTELRTLEIMKTRPGQFFSRRKQPAFEAMTIG